MDLNSNLKCVSTSNEDILTLQQSYLEINLCFHDFDCKGWDINASITLPSNKEFIACHVWKLLEKILKGQQIIFCRLEEMKEQFTDYNHHLDSNG